MEDPRLVLSALKQLLHETEGAESLYEKASLYAAARWLMADLEAEFKKHGFESRDYWEAFVRLHRAFGGLLGIEPVDPEARFTVGSMGLYGLDDLIGKLED